MPEALRIARLLDASFHIIKERFGEEVDLAITAARKDDRSPQLIPVFDGEEDTTFLIDAMFVLAAEHFHALLEAKTRRIGRNPRFLPLITTNRHSNLLARGLQ